MKSLELSEAAADATGAAAAAAALNVGAWSEHKLIHDQVGDWRDTSLD